MINRLKPSLVVTALVTSFTLSLSAPSPVTADTSEADIGNAAARTAAGSISLGTFHTCAVIDGGVQCWGSNLSGQLGNTTNTDSARAVVVSGLTGVNEISAGGNHTCALLSGGSVRCWGENGDGQLGNGSTTDSNVPVAVTGLAGVTAIAAGGDHSCALLSDQTVTCWGADDLGQLGNGASPASTTPSAVTGLTGVTAISAGADHSCALLATGTMKCWGHNGYGQLGNGSTTSSATAVDVRTSSGDSTALSGVLAITSGSLHTCALRTGGGVKCWGYGDNGRLGDGTAGTNRTSPVDVKDSAGTGLLTGVSVISAGNPHTCALTTSGVLCWGRGSFGQLGTGNTTDSNLPVSATGLTGVAAVNAGHLHTCAFLNDETVKCWGLNSYGQIGDNSDTNVVLQRNSPVDVVLALSSPPSSSPAPVATPTAPTTTTTTTIPDTVFLKPGQFIVTVNSVEVTATITMLPDGRVRVSGPGFAVTFAGATGGNGNEIFVDQGGLISISGSGFKSGTRIDVVFANNNQSLGSAPISTNGTFSTQMPIPAGTRAGEHEIRATGIAADGSTRVIALGLLLGTVKRSTIAEFEGFSATLTPVLLARVRQVLANNPNARAVKCQGFVKVTQRIDRKDIALARQRATNVCSYLQTSRPSMHTTVTRGFATENRRRVELTLRD